MFILLLGQVFIVPIITEILHVFSNNSPNIALLNTNDVSQLVPTSLGSVQRPVNVFPSYWMAHIAFFFGYILSNAVSMYLQEPDLSLIRGASSDAMKISINRKIAARKEKALTLVISTLCLFVLITFLRVNSSGAETFGGILISLLVFGAGYGWYIAAENLGAKNSDIFGIAMQMMSPDSAATKPKTCVYTGKP